MSDNVCQRCQTPVQPSERLLCELCFTQFLWEDVWPSMEEVIHRSLPASWQAVLKEQVTQQLTAVWRHASIRGLAPNAPLHTHVQAAATRWRTLTASLEELRSLAGDLPPPVHLAGLTYLAVAIRHLARQYMRQHCNFDRDQKRFVSDSVGPQLTPDGEISLSLAEINTLTAVYQDAVLCETMLFSGLMAWGAQQLERKGANECMQAAVEAMLTVLQALPLFLGTLMESPLEHQQVQGALSVAGWSATQLSLHHNHRLRHAVEQDGNPSEQSPFVALLAQLPGAVHLAYSTDPDASLDALLTNIKHVLEPGASRTRAKGSQDALPSVQPSVEDMWLREEARKAMDIANPTVRNKLTPRERELCDLMYERAHQEEAIAYANIAVHMGVAVGTVKSTLAHIRAKLRNPANA